MSVVPFATVSGADWSIADAEDWTVDKANVSIM